MSRDYMGRPGAVGGGGATLRRLTDSVLVALLVLASLGGCATGSPVPGGAGGSGLVTNVVDGDTLDVDGVGRVRVIGIDTPERGACGYESATLAMAAQVLGRSVSLVPGAVDDSDRYGRLLRYVEVDGTDAGLRLIEDGWAIARYDSRDGYGRHLREDAYVKADAEAPDLGCYPDDEP